MLDTAIPMVGVPPKVESFSKPVSGWTVCRATITKELLMAGRYMPDLIGRVVEATIKVSFFLLMATSISVENVDALSGANLSSHSLSLFYLSSLMLMVFNGTALSSPIISVNRDLYFGTLEFLYSGPSSRYAYFIGTVLASAIINQVTFLPIFLFYVFYSGVSLFNVLLVLGVCALVLVTMVSMGIMIALLTLLLKQMGSIASLISQAFEFLAGAYLPISVLPVYIRVFAYVLPYTWGYDLIRYYSLNGNWKTFYPVWIQWSALIGFAIIFVIVSRYLLQQTEIRAKKEGLHLL
ncbi:MAG TPA: ABC transporter permease [Herpetosiphonaceae bacterium]